MRPCASDMIHINETHSFDPKVYAEKRISILFGMVPDMKGNIDFVGLLGPTLYIPTLYELIYPMVTHVLMFM